MFKCVQNKLGKIGLEILGNFLEQILEQEEKEGKFRGK